MSFQITEPVIIVGIGGAGSRMAGLAAEAAGVDCVCVGHGAEAGSGHIGISTGGVVNPSVRLLRAAAYQEAGRIRDAINGYNTVIMIGNLAGKSGAAISPVVSGICKEAGTGLLSFCMMPFGYEKGRIFESGIALKRLREDSGCTIIIDNDSMMQSNPDLTPAECYHIADSAVRHVVCSLGSSQMSGTNVLGSGRAGKDAEESLRDSLCMLYGSAPPGSARRSMIYVMGGISSGAIDSICKIAGGMVGEGETRVDSEGSGVVMVSTVHGTTKFDGYDPLGAIPQGETLDWSVPECSIDCGLEIYQME